MRGLTRARKRASEMALNAGGGAINWFPGHMAAASRAIRDRLKLADLVIGVRDARVSPSLARYFTPPLLTILWDCGNVGGGRRLLVLGRCSMKYLSYMPIERDSPETHFEIEHEILGSECVISTIDDGAHAKERVASTSWPNMLHALSSFNSSLHECVCLLVVFPVTLITCLQLM